MYRIDESEHKEKYRMIIPATLDAHFPLLKYMFWTKDYWVDILDDDKDITDLGLKYANNEICYPYILMVGQVVKELRKHPENVANTRLLLPTAGDACRGACYIGLFQKSLMKANLSECKVLTLNVRHVAEEINMDLSYAMGARGLCGMFYGDILMLLANQIRPYEKEKGATDRLWKEWVDRLSEDLRTGKHLNPIALKRNFNKICDSFLKIEKTGEKKQRIGLVGEFYAKYCALGNWNVQSYMESQGCEVHINGLSWYAIYYIDTHMPEHFNLEQVAFRAARWLLKSTQKKMIKSLRKRDFYVLPTLDVLKKNSEKYVSRGFTIGDGWLMGSEVVGYVNSDCKKVLCIAPFGCMANACAGRGLYPHLQREFPGSAITVVETDASGAEGNYYNRVQMLIHAKLM